MVADDGERLAGVNQAPHQPDHPDAVRSAITQVAHKHQLALVGMDA